MISADNIIDLRPCWLTDRRDGAGQIRALVGSGVTHLQIAEADGISIADRRWLLTRLAARSLDGRKIMVRWAARCAESALDRIADDDRRDRARRAIDTAVAWTEGRATSEECSAAAYAAYAAYAAASAAYAAAYAAYAAASAADATASAAASAAAYADSAYADSAAAAAFLIDLATALDAAKTGAA